MENQTDKSSTEETPMDVPSEEPLEEVPPVEDPSPEQEDPLPHESIITPKGRKNQKYFDFVPF